jgi:two-component system capsular synthesis response regulator RcsB
MHTATPSPLPRIVIADDHSLVRKGLRLLIEDARAAVVVGEASSTTELMQLLAGVDCDLLVTDFSMPSPKEDDGTRMLRKVARLRPALPVIVLTMASNIHLIRAMLVAGVKAIVGKGDGMPELLYAIHAASSGRTYLSASIRNLLQVTTGDALDAGLAPTLSARESEVLRLYASGLSVSAIAKVLQTSRKTVSRQKVGAMEKLSLLSDLEIYEYARVQGLRDR